MTADESNFKSFNDFGADDIDPHASISQRMIRRLETIDDANTSGPTTPEARAALASSVVAHAVVELEAELIKLKRQLAARR